MVRNGQRDGVGSDSPPARRPGWGRRMFLLLTGAAVALVAVAALGTLPGLPQWVPTIPNPFEERTVDRSQPAVLQSIQDLSRFTAASGSFEVVIDVERDRRFIPDFLVGERILFVAAGNVDAYVEFGGLTGDALMVDQDNGTVQVTLPPPELAPVNLDHERSYVYAQEQGAATKVVDIFGDDSNELQEVLVLAEDRIAEAAGASELPARAEENTRTMLVGMLSTLGYDTVQVEFVAP
jgi:hypothetical protein